MRIVNAMFAQGRGGIEQASVDYGEALTLAGHEVLALVHPGSWAEEAQAPGVTVRAISNRGSWDLFASERIKRAMKAFGADAAIGHGNRAVTLLRRAARGARPPVIGVAHNYSIRRFEGLRAAFGVTDDLTTLLAELGVEKAFTIPNMIRLTEARPRRAWRAPPVIGAMGRFVAKKGFADFVEALALLKARGVAFEAVLGGGGEEEASLRALAAERGVDVRFIGWVEDKAAFFDSIDVFVLPSLHEPFGIVLLEAFAHGVPAVAAETEGPHEIVQDGEALLVPPGEPAALANALAALLADPARAAEMAVKARAAAEARYALPVVSARLDAALREIVG